MTSYVPDRHDLDGATAAGSVRDPLLARAARYARWDGSQTIPALDADEIMDALADDVMAEGDLGEALRRLGAFDVTDGAEEPSVVASAVEFIFEGLHLSRRINKDRAATGTVYRR